MGHMQPTYGPRTDNTYLTTGGNKTLVNGDEAPAITATYEGMACVCSDLGEDDSCVTGVYAEHSAGQQM